MNNCLLPAFARPAGRNDSAAFTFFTSKTCICCLNVPGIATGCRAHRRHHSGDSSIASPLEGADVALLPSKSSATTTEMARCGTSTPWATPSTMRRPSRRAHSRAGTPAVTRFQRAGHGRCSTFLSNKTSVAVQAAAELRLYALGRSHCHVRHPKRLPVSRECLRNI